MRILKIIVKNVSSHFELITWVAIVIMLFFIDPGEHHFSLCPLHNMGISCCPGCGLGRACSLALHGRFAASLSMHPFGIFAILVIIHRIYSLIINSFPSINQNTKCYE